MKKRKKNNKPIIILFVGIVLFGSLIGYSIYGFNEHKKFVIEDRKNFENDIANKKKDCETSISTKQKEIETIENQIDAIDGEITLLQRQKTDEFMNSRGWSDRYYALEDQITAKRKEQTKKREEISQKKKEITKFENTIWEIDNDFDEYKYKQPGFKKGNPYLTLVIGIIGCIITFFAAGISQLIKSISSEKSYSEYNEIDDGILSEIDVNDGKLLKRELYSKLENLLIASSKNDYDIIRKLCTKNMAKSYIDELDLLKKHKQKIFIKDIENDGTKIVSVRKNQHNRVVTIVQKVKLFQYTKNISTNDIIDGYDNKKQVQAFKLVFVKNYEVGHNFKKCPNCGANIKDSTKVDCAYCGTVFDNNNYDWYLESKVIISED